MTPVLPQRLVADDPGHLQEDQQDRELEADPERQHHVGDQLEVLVGRVRLGDVVAADVREPLQRLRQRPVRDSRAQREQRQRRRDERQRVAALVPVQARRHEPPDLPQDHGHRERDRDVHGDPDAHGEALDGARGDQVAAGDALRRDRLVRVQQEVGHPRVEEPADDAREADCGDAHDEPTPKLDHVLHQGHATLVGASCRQRFGVHHRVADQAAGSSGFDCGTSSSLTDSSGGRAASSNADRISFWNPWDMRRSSPMTLPTLRAASGSLSGPRTIRAMRRMTMISPAPTLNMPRIYRSTVRRLPRERMSSTDARVTSAVCRRSASASLSSLRRWHSPRSASISTLLLRSWPAIRMAPPANTSSGTTHRTLTTPRLIPGRSLRTISSYWFTIDSRVSNQPSSSRMWWKSSRSSWLMRSPKWGS